MPKASTKNSCKMSDCSGGVVGRGFCNRHYLQHKKGNLTFGGQWFKEVKERNRSVRCYPQGALCKMSDCGGKAKKNYFCNTHYDQYRKRMIDLEGNVLREKRHPAPRYINNGGYVLLHTPDHPHVSSRGYMMEHRLVMEEVLGRYLGPDESVHHKDGNKQNNSPENLELRATKSHGEGHEWTADEVLRGMSAIRQFNPRSYKVVLEELGLTTKEEIDG